MFLKITLITLGCLLILFLIISLYLIAPKKPNKKNNDKIDQIKFAHRGLHDAKNNIPENSMAAFKKAVESGYGIEMDIRETKDKKIVIFHDDSLKRMCNIDNEVNELTFDELQKFTLQETNEKIPTFEEFLKLVNGKVPLLIEYKSNLYGEKCKAFCERANAILKKYQGDYIIESFNYSILGWYRKNMPNILRGQLGMGMQCYDVALGKERSSKIPMKNKRRISQLLGNFIGRPNFISYRWEDINFVVKLNKFLGAKIACWLVTDKDSADKLLKKYDCIIFERYLA